MTTNRTGHILITCAVTAFLGLTLAPRTAESCSPYQTDDFLPSNGEVIPPSASLFVVSPHPRWTGTPPTIEYGDEDPWAIPHPSDLSYVGHLGDNHQLLAYEPPEPLATGQYTFYSPTLVDPDTTSSTFEVSDEVAYETPPAINDLTWHTRVFDTTQQPLDSCEREFQQRSRLIFPRVEQTEERRSLIYKIKLISVGDFDGDVDHSDVSRWYMKISVVVDPASDNDAGRWSFGTIEDDTVAVDIPTQFKAECVEITVRDLTGQESEPFVQCMPQRCAPPVEADPWDDEWTRFEDIDWSTQPDCSQVYCYEGDCDAPSEDAGTPSDDAGPANDAGDAGVDETADASDAEDVSAESDAGQTDIGQSDIGQADISGDAADATRSGQSSGSESAGCSTTRGDVPSGGSAAAALLAALALGWRGRRRA